MYTCVNVCSAPPLLSTSPPTARPSYPSPTPTTSTQTSSARTAPFPLTLPHPHQHTAAGAINTHTNTSTPTHFPTTVAAHSPLLPHTHAPTPRELFFAAAAAAIASTPISVSQSTPPPLWVTQLSTSTSENVTSILGSEASILGREAGVVQEGVCGDEEKEDEVHEAGRCCIYIYLHRERGGERERGRGGV